MPLLKLAALDDHAPISPLCADHIHLDCDGESCRCDCHERREIENPLDALFD